MSRLDSAIRRLEAQRACLGHGVALVADLPGPFLEMGLGNGRTYDHLRELCPTREIFVFERQIAAHPDCVPDADHLFLGDVRETLPDARERFARGVALIHADIGTGDAALNAALAACVADHLPSILRPGGIVIADQDMPFAGSLPVALPDGVKPGRYYMYQAA